MNNIQYRTFNQYDSNLLCIDNGFFENYCPNKEFPFINKIYFPFEFVVNEENNIYPKYYFDNNNNIKIIFKTLYEYNMLEDVYKLHVVITPVNNYDMYVYSLLLIVACIIWMVYLIYNKRYLLLWYNLVSLVLIYEINFKGEYGYFM